MPELPEVETIRRQLAPHLEGRTIVDAEILDPRWTRPLPPGPIAAELRGARVEGGAGSGNSPDLRRADDRPLRPHLGRPGALRRAPPADPRHTRVRFEVDDGHRIVYVDPRRFGTGQLLPDSEASD